MAGRAAHGTCVWSQGRSRRQCGGAGVPCSTVVWPHGGRACGGGRCGPRQRRGRLEVQPLTSPCRSAGCSAGSQAEDAEELLGGCEGDPAATVAALNATLSGTENLARSKLELTCDVGGRVAVACAVPHAIAAVCRRYRTYLPRPLWLQACELFVRFMARLTKWQPLEACGCPHNIPQADGTNTHTIALCPRCSVFVYLLRALRAEVQAASQVCTPPCRIPSPIPPLRTHGCYHDSTLTHQACFAAADALDGSTGAHAIPVARPVCSGPSSPWPAACPLAASRDSVPPLFPPFPATSCLPPPHPMAGPT